MYRLVGLSVGFLAGVWAGAIAGATLGILFAPRKGEETRAHIRRKVMETRAKTLEQIAHKKEAMQQKASEAASTTRDAIDNAEEKLRDTSDTTPR